MIQHLVIKVEFDPAAAREPRAWDWSTIVGDPVEVLAWGPPVEVPNA